MKLKLNIFNDEFNDFSEGLEKNLCLLTEYILTDQGKDKFTINLKFVTTYEMKSLNKSFRNINSDTNVLSFPTSTDVKKISGELGDIAMSIPYIKTESQNLNRDLDDHMMHLLAHGILHLLGFDHNKDKNADMMEAQEIKYLNSFKIANPYKI
ncbi:MAG: rRNA maturation RNase YbeY [Gammaproteobacteria bacterium]|nr:rRNA maturation RNase YbeY [Gammaproteobacteria bacterium]